MQPQYSIIQKKESKIPSRIISEVTSEYVKKARVDDFKFWISQQTEVERELRHKIMGDPLFQAGALISIQRFLYDQNHYICIINGGGVTEGSSYNGLILYLGRGERLRVSGNLQPEDEAIWT